MSDQKLFNVSKTLMTSEGLGEMFEGYFADTCAKAWSGYYNEWQIRRKIMSCKIKYFLEFKGGKKNELRNKKERET